MILVASGAPTNDRLPSTVPVMATAPASFFALYTEPRTVLAVPAIIWTNGAM